MVTGCRRPRAPLPCGACAGPHVTSAAPGTTHTQRPCRWLVLRLSVHARPPSARTQSTHAPAGCATERARTQRTADDGKRCACVRERLTGLCDELASCPFECVVCSHMLCSGRPRVTRNGGVGTRGRGRSGNRGGGTPKGGGARTVSNPPPPCDQDAKCGPRLRACCSALSCPALHDELQSMRLTSTRPRWPVAPVRWSPPPPPPVYNIRGYTRNGSPCAAGSV